MVFVCNVIGEFFYCHSEQSEESQWNCMSFVAALVISSECEKSQKNIKYYGKYSSVLGVHYVK